ncbi:MAG: aldo/keto reductase, partial [Rhodococcus sp. (in: high G+C Gram-positive bacteria)]|nr:aldo/keto reductase [Rhodococcus sp. (in: high G+C Gram-positive bacteria)]
MKHRSVGTSGLRVSRLGLGTLTWGRDTDGDEAAAQLLAFAEAGGTLVDTSPAYGAG